MGKLNGKLAVITGASRGIGAATAKAFALAGAEVILLARTQQDLDLRLEEIEQAGGKGHALAVDLSDGALATATAIKIIAEYGVPDILVNNAGVGRWLFVEDTPPEEVEMMIKLPYLAAFWMTSAFLPGMLERGSGRILMVNSPVSIITWGASAGYAASRYAMRGLTESLRIDLHGTGVSVCHCLFGETSSDYFKANPGAHERLPSLAKYIRVMTTEEVAAGLLKVSTGKRKRIHQPFMIAFFIWTMVRFPGITKWILRKVSYKRPKGNISPPHGR